MTSNYLSTVRRVLRNKALLEETVADWKCPQARAGLGFYVRASENRRRSFMRAVYPVLYRSLDADLRKRLLDTYLAAHAGADPCWSRNAQTLLGTVQTMVEQRAMPAAVLELATHEWTLFETSLSEQVPEPWQSAAHLSPNPTLQIREYLFDWPSWLKGEQPPGTYPDHAPCSILLAYYLHPETLSPWWWRVDDASLAAMRVADDAIPLDEAAVRCGVPVESLATSLERFATSGLLTARTG